MKNALTKLLLAAGSIGVLGAAMTSCAAAKAAMDHTAQGGGAAGGGLLFYVTSIALGATGWVAAGIAGIGGWIGSWFFTPKAPPGAGPAAGFPWGGLVVVALIVLALRAWAHYPEMLRHLWALVKVAARGLLGGLKRPPTGS